MTESLFPLPRTDVVRVALPVPVDTLFAYAVPRELVTQARPGCRVRVPFETRRMTGVIVDAAPPDQDGADRRLRLLEGVLDPEPVLSPTLLSILQEAATEALCPVGLALATALPPGGPPSSRPGVRLTARGAQALAVGAVSPATTALLEALTDGPRTRAFLERRSGAREQLRSLEQDGLVARVPVDARSAVRIPTRRMVRTAPGLDLDAVLSETLARAPRQAELLRALSPGESMPATQLTRTSRSSVAALRELARRGLVEVTHEPVPSRVLGTHLETGHPPQLSPEQHQAAEAIAACIGEGRHEKFLLHGVTGSGKTEVYLRAVAQALEVGRQALVLVPEITLTHQIVARLRGRFGDGLAILHSGLRPGERLDQWQRLHGGRIPIAVGARSALFAPLDNLGVVIVDEEHDSAYKNEEGFRYHAVRLAGMRAAAARCPLVLGSATPALETRYASDDGGLRRLVLPHRVTGRPLPSVTIVDMARERAALPRGRKLVLSRPLRRALQEILSEGGQSILFLNRRGFSTQILCFQCHHVERCKHCDISLVYHSTEQRLRCHYCDFQIGPPELCSACGAPDTALLGLGTERLEEEVREILPDARVGRLDRDTSSRRGAAERILADLRLGRIDILVGTQMVAKGHDFPGVRLVGVVNADLGLHFPDFRAAERTFALLTQVAGRAGRGKDPGRVLIQTHTPDHPAIRRARTHDYEGFYLEELRHRRELGYPPFGSLALVRVSGPDEAKAAAAAGSLASRVRPGHDTRDLEVLGPVPATVKRLRDRFRFQLLLKGPRPEVVWQAARTLATACARLPTPLRGTVDAHPVNLL